jgi:BirA family biotin operon repressor/biotin-[acetyl-CoA-carboxylase] ligase
VGPRKIIRLDVTESTNSVALELGGQGAPPGTVVVTATQTRGRGRLNRSWMSPPGMGLYFSQLLRPKLTLEHLPKITLAAGLAVCKAIEALFFIAPQIKWPNDLLLDGRKFGGILSETGSVPNISPEDNPLVVVGVGLNLFPPADGFPAAIKDRATTLAEHVEREISADLLMEACAKAIEEMVQRLEKGDFPAILKEWKQRDAIGSRILSWITPQGKEVRGVSLGPDADGVLHIRDDAGTVHPVISGDVNLVGKFLP